MRSRRSSKALKKLDRGECLLANCCSDSALGSTAAFCGCKVHESIVIMDVSVTTACNLSASLRNTLATASFDMIGCASPCLSNLIKSGRCKAVVYLYQDEEDAAIVTLYYILIVHVWNISLFRLLYVEHIQYLYLHSGIYDIFHSSDFYMCNIFSST